MVCKRTPKPGDVLGMMCPECHHVNVMHDAEGCILCGYRQHLADIVDQDRLDRERMDDEHG